MLLYDDRFVQTLNNNCERKQVLCILHCGNPPSTAICLPPDFVSSSLINHAVQRCQHCTNLMPTEDRECDFQRSDVNQYTASSPEGSRV